MATDIAFTLGLIALLGKRVPSSLIVFVSALAIADDLGAIFVIAMFYGHGFHIAPLLGAMAVFAVMIGLNRGRVYRSTPYLILGTLLWYLVLRSGLHATLVGVLTGFVIPSRKSGNVFGVASQVRSLFDSELASANQNEDTGTLTITCRQPLNAFKNLDFSSDTRGLFEMIFQFLLQLSFCRIHAKASKLLPTTRQPPHLKATNRKSPIEIC